MLEVYSFDIFDTLLLRPYANPQEVWRVLEEQEHAPGFAKARKAADAKTFKEAIARNGETTIEAAYELIPQYKHLMQKEMDLERQVLRANPEMLKMWKELGAQGKHRIIVSDMYLSSDFIQDVLRENGFDGWDGFYLSRDYDCRKSSGKLFELMLQKESVKPEDVLHIGDNLISDVKMPASLGIHTQHYKKVIDRLYEVCPFTKHIDGRLSGALAIGWHQFLLDHPNATYWHRLGFMMGGVLGYIYVKWIVETAKKLGKDRLMFVARDGFVWKAMCNVLYREIETDYFYAPRLTSIAVLGAIGSDPWAIKDRQSYIDKHLRNADVSAIQDSYSHYLKQFAIDEKTAMVDGCSSGFSAQRLVEKAVGHDVFCFYLLAMAKKDDLAALYQTNLYSLQWQRFSEFLFGAPEPPIRGVTNNSPVYSNDISGQEQFKMDVSNDIKDGALACALTLRDEQIAVSAKDWIEYVDVFMMNLTEEDKQELSKAKNAADVEQKQFHQISYEPLPMNRVFLRKQGNYLFSINVTMGKKWFKVWLGRDGLHYFKKDVSIAFESYNCKS